MQFNTADMKKFNEKYIFVPKYLRRLWGDDGLQPMEDFEEVEFVDTIAALAGDLEAQSRAMHQHGEEWYDKDFDFSTIFSRDRYEDNLAGTDVENMDGGKADWNGVLVCAYTGFAPTHQMIGFEVAGTIERLQDPVTGLEVPCSW